MRTTQKVVNKRFQSHHLHFSWVSWMFRLMIFIQQQTEHISIKWEGLSRVGTTITFLLKTSTASKKISADYIHIVELYDVTRKKEHISQNRKSTTVWRNYFLWNNFSQKFFHLTSQQYFWMLSPFRKLLEKIIFSWFFCADRENRLFASVCFILTGPGIQKYEEKKKKSKHQHFDSYHPTIFLPNTTLWFSEKQWLGTVQPLVRGNGWYHKLLYYIQPTAKLSLSVTDKDSWITKSAKLNDQVQMMAFRTLIATENCTTEILQKLFSGFRKFSNLLMLCILKCICLIKKLVIQQQQQNI